MKNGKKSIKDLGPDDDIFVTWMQGGEWKQTTVKNIDWHFTKKLLNAKMGVTHVHRFVAQLEAEQYISNRNKAFAKGQS